MDRINNGRAICVRDQRVVHIPWDNKKGETFQWDTDVVPACISYKVIKGQNWRTLKNTLSKFVLDRSFVVIITVFKFHNIWLRQT